MSDMVDRISNHDDAEKARKENVGAQSKDVFYALFKALEDRVFRYNDRHPQDSGFPKAVFIRDPQPSSTRRFLTIQKNIEPTSSLVLDFPINSGAMQVELSAKTKKLSGSITLDVVNNAPTYYFHGKTHSAETMADLLLEPVLSETGFLAAGRKIGFV